MKSLIKISCLLLLVAALLGSSSCKRQNAPMELTIKGIVKETQTGKPLNDIKVRVSRIKSSNGGFGSYEEIIGEAWTNSDGFYEMKLNVNRNEDINIVAEAGKLGYFGPPTHEHQVSSSLFQYDIDLAISGYIDIYLENKDAYYDSIIIHCDIEGGRSAPIFHQFIGVGLKRFDYKVFMTAAGKNIKLKCTVNKKGVIKEYINYIDVPHWDTAFFRGSF